MTPGRAIPPARAQRAMLAADHGRGRALMGWAYRSAARCYAAYVRRGEPGAAAYLRGSVASGEALHGLTDVDIAVVLGPDPTGAARERVRRRCVRVARSVPALGRLVDDWPLIFDHPGLEEVAMRSMLTYGLHEGRAAYSGPGCDIDKIRALERPGLYGPGCSWQLLSGPERRPATTPPDAEARRITAWLELQNWWRWAFEACATPERPQSAYMCVKLIAEAVRIWLWLTRGEYVRTRNEALAQGPLALPSVAEAFERATQLRAALSVMPRAPLEDYLPPFARLSDQLAEELARQVAPAGVTEVRLLWPGHRELALPHGGTPGEDALVSEGNGRALLPLVDWRSLAVPTEPDETFTIVNGDAGDPRFLAAVAVPKRGPYGTLTWRRLMLRPVRMGGRGRLRSVNCEVTDPVSFALARGEGMAPFPNTSGFSIQDTARRAVAEHAARLLTCDPERGGFELGCTITAARAALLWQSITDGDPELPLTVDATLEALADRSPGAEPVAAAAREAYHQFARTWNDPPDKVTTALRAAVLALPAYASSQPIATPA